MGKLLVVDDDELLRSCLASILAFAGHDVVEAKDGLQALIVYQALHGSISLTLMDLDMPRMDGISARGVIKEACPSAKVILMSGHGGLPSTGVGSDTFLLKPFSGTELCKVVQKMLQADTPNATSLTQSVDKLDPDTELFIERDDFSPLTVKLRSIAEQNLTQKHPESNDSISLSECQRMVHELQVYQIELEMMNEELGVNHDGLRAWRAEAALIQQEFQQIIEQLNFMADCPEKFQPAIHHLEDTIRPFEERFKRLMQIGEELPE